MISRLSVLLIACLLAGISHGFAPSNTASVTRAVRHSPTTATTLNLAAAVMPNPFKKLPWNVKKEQDREARRLKLERNQLFRQLGIPEDATYEEIVMATDNLIAAAGSDLKQKVKVEIAKDRILQIRLNERVAGLTILTKEARAQSTFEMEGENVDEDDTPSKGAKEWNAPLWTKGLIVKPNEEQIKSQVKLWGILTGLGLALPPVIDYLGRFTWLICVAQLTFRGMSAEDRDRGGMGAFSSGGKGGGHRKVAFALGFTIWIAGLGVVYGLMPAWAKGQRWTGQLAYTLQNLIFATASCYLQPYKG
eukprot:CAMPEP_0198136826 /NCGR_PEP_ID=MMETSP1443-20131203/409_1 /TAXON_ID=186043 /ORGANISM="Entomoneis sp., Strain CCMP2396" /LENGTH=305 /DNA_ID=CAMNT_0043798105 /DNA_START=157 /DNA_END=1074 /DNA_ORIENTATION=-